jgi:hypothetical protein
MSNMGRCTEHGTSEILEHGVATPSHTRGEHLPALPVRHAGGSGEVSYLTDGGPDNGPAGWWWIATAADGTYGEAPEDAAYITDGDAIRGLRAFLSDHQVTG